MPIVTGRNCAMTVVCSHEEVLRTGRVKIEFCDRCGHLLRYFKATRTSKARHDSGIRKSV